METGCDKSSLERGLKISLICSFSSPSAVGMKTISSERKLK